MVAPLAALLLIILVVALALSGHSPRLRSLVPFTAKGLIAVAPSNIARVEIRAGQQSVALRRDPGGWDDCRHGRRGSSRACLAHRCRAAVHAGQRTDTRDCRQRTHGRGLRGIRARSASQCTGAQYRGWDGRDGELRRPQSGRHLPVCSASRRPNGLPDGAAHGAEWQLVGDMARRLRGQVELAAAGRGTSLLLPVSLAQVWAVEIVFAGKLTRFERDGAGEWFRHVGQHSHLGGTNVHVADPAQARMIGAAFEAFDEIAVETRVAHDADEAELTRFGLVFPPLIVLLYARDSSTALARLELGAAADSFDRYARLAPHGDVVTVAEFEAKRLIELLKAVGAGS